MRFRKHCLPFDSAWQAMGVNSSRKRQRLDCKASRSGLGSPVYSASPPPRGGILCLAGSETVATVREMARKCGLEFMAVSGCMEAKRLLMQGGPWGVLVASLGTREVNLLLDQGSSRSTVISTAKALPVPPLVVIFSNTACRRGGIAQSCREAGADIVICTEEALLDLLIPPAPRVLCLAGSQTTSIVKAVATDFGLELVTVSTVAAAVDQLMRGGPWGAVVGALGTQPGVDVIFDGGLDRTGGADRSSFVMAAKSLIPAPLVVIFSHTACQRRSFAQVCYDAGVDSVICSEEGLRELAVEVEAKVALNGVLSGLPASRGLLFQIVLSTQVHKKRVFPYFKSAADYPVIAQRIDWDRNLEIALGSEHKLAVRSKRYTRALQDMIEILPRPLTIEHTEACRPIRFVHLSDTHHHHNRVHLPTGDVLLHTGDLVGNYGTTDLRQHYADFLEWLIDVSLEFRLVVFIAGNHDTLLDESHYPDSDVRDALLKSLPPNVVYLNNSGVEFEGLRIWGSPTMVCREETMGKRYLSSAFERPRVTRKKIWAAMPSGLDVLMTHVPPQGYGCSDDVGCSVLASRLRELCTPPRYHCFGHDHDHFGVSGNAHTTFINGAQEEVLRMDKGAKSCAWVFDLLLGS